MNAMNGATKSTFPMPPRDSGLHKIRSYTGVGGVAEKTALFASDAPTGPCVVKFWLPAQATEAKFHLEGTSGGAADSSPTNGLRLDGYYIVEQTVQVDPAVDTHLDVYIAAGISICWMVVG